MLFVSYVLPGDACLSVRTLRGRQMYVALFPCNECAKLIIQSGIREVIFVSDKYHDTCVGRWWCPGYQAV